MFRRLHLKFSFISLTIIAVIMAVIVFMLNYNLALTNYDGSERFMQDLLEHDGHLPAFEYERFSYNHGTKSEKQDSHLSIIKFLFPFSPMPAGFRNFYSGLLNSSGRLYRTISDFSSSETNEELNTIIARMFADRTADYSHKLYDGYAFRMRPYADGYLIVILDRRNEIHLQFNFTLISLAVFFVSLVIAFFICWGFSFWAIKPVKEAFVRQKQFIADASHELKTPVAVIGANADVLEQEIPGNKWLEYIKKENMHMSALIKDLLFLARNDSGRLEMNPVRFDLASCCACAVLPFESVVFEQGKKLETEIPQTPVYVYADESRIKQCLVIFLDNALKNSENGDLVRVSAGMSDGKCFIKVFNTGHGIPKDALTKIFNRFYRADSSRARATGGCGLGLSIAKTIADSHHARITVNSVEGKNAEFTLYLNQDLRHRISRLY